MVQKPAGAVFYRNAREESKIIVLARRLWRKHGKERAKARALDIRGFPLRWETRGSQDRRLGLSRFFRLFNGSGLAG